MGKTSSISLGAVLRARCPACRKGPVTKGLFAIHRRCQGCGYDFHPEPGFYLGAMMVGFLVTAVLTVPPMIVLKILNVDTAILIVFPFIEYLVLGTFLVFYSRVLWLHLEHRMRNKLDG